ncbi:hypothetical protein lpari_02787 [Legionella parisiensis]|uniref:CN hydrolase domain-containing protein n=1 Tax=Legionella parisiensis TaxID=45071 RepID=A0A1E5JQX4_9GAMM|nr:hypothetical protein lpari_02787 [Legionella parisiensis]
MQNKLTVLMAQINPLCALTSNRDQIIEIIKSKQAAHNVILFPELALTGYPPEDLLFRREFQQAVAEHLKQIQTEIKDCYVLVGHPSMREQRLYNSVSIFIEAKKLQNITSKIYRTIKFLMKHVILPPEKKIHVFWK